MADVLGRFDISREHGADPLPDSMLSGNRVIEEAIARFQANTTRDNLYLVLDAILTRARASGQFVIPIIPPQAMFDMIDADHVRAGDIVTSRDEYIIAFLLPSNS